MKKEDIENYELGEHCYGSILRVNGKDYEDLSEQEIMEFIMEMFDKSKNINSYNFIQETLKNALNYLEFDCAESSNSSCEQCGSWNNYQKFSKE